MTAANTSTSSYLVHVQQLSGATCHVSVPETALVRDVLHELGSVCSLPGKRRLLFQGRVLREDEALSSLSADGFLEVQLIRQQLRAQRVEASEFQGHEASKMLRTFHFSFCGEHSVGKSGLMWRYAENLFQELPTGSGHDFKIIHLMAGEMPVKLFLWDWPTGTERFRPIPVNFLRQKTAVLVVVDVTNPTCLEDVDQWLSMMRAEHIPTKLLLGNKIDATKERQLPREKAEVFAVERGLYYFETSAKDGTGVVEAIDFAIFDALEKLPEPATVPAHSYPNPSFRFGAQLSKAKAAQAEATRVPAHIGPLVFRDGLTTRPVTAIGHGHILNGQYVHPVVRRLEAPSLVAKFDGPVERLQLRDLSQMAREAHMPIAGTALDELAAETAADGVLNWTNATEPCVAVVAKPQDCNTWTESREGEGQTRQVVIQPITYDSRCRSVTQQMMAALAVANRHEEAADILILLFLEFGAGKVMLQADVIISGVWSGQVPN
eukprot:Skav223363  [mRNA]  locus=scaffold200:568489:587282:+ [translate_table: standard]